MRLLTTGGLFWATKMRLSACPNEILFQIATYLSISDISNWSRANRHLNACLALELHRCAVREDIEECWPRSVVESALCGNRLAFRSFLKLTPLELQNSHFNPMKILRGYGRSCKAGIGRGHRVIKRLYLEKVNRRRTPSTVLMRVLCMLYEESSPEDEYGEMFRLAVSHGATDKLSRVEQRSAFITLADEAKTSAFKYFVDHDSTVVECRLDTQYPCFEFIYVVRCSLKDAIYNRQIDIVHVLIGIDPEAQVDEEGYIGPAISYHHLPMPHPTKLLSYAALYSSFEIFEALLKSFPSHKLNGDILQNALDCAVYAGNPPIVEILFQNKTKPSAELLKWFMYGYPSTCAVTPKACEIQQSTLRKRAQILELIMENCDESFLFGNPQSVPLLLTWRQNSNLCPLEPFFTRYPRRMWDYFIVSRDVSLLHINFQDSLTEEERSFVESVTACLIESGTVDISHWTVVRAVWSCQVEVLEQIRLRAPEKIHFHITDLATVMDTTESVDKYRTIRWLIQHAPPNQRQYQLQLLVLRCKGLYWNALAKTILMIKYLLEFGDVDITRCPPVITSFPSPFVPLVFAIEFGIKGLILYLLSLEAVKSDISGNPLPIFNKAIDTGQVEMIKTILTTVPEIFSYPDYGDILLRTLTTAVDTRGAKYFSDTISSTRRKDAPIERRMKHRYYFQLFALTLLIPSSDALTTACKKYLRSTDARNDFTQANWIELIREMIVRAKISDKDAAVIFFRTVSCLTDAAPDIQWDFYMQIAQKAGWLPARGWPLAVREDKVILDMCHQFLEGDEEEVLSSIPQMFGFDMM